MSEERKPLHTGVALTTVDDATKLANTLGRANLLPAHIQGAPDAVLLMLSGAELGFGPMASLRLFHLVEGRVTLAAEAMLAIVASKGVVFRWIETSETRAEIELARGGGFAPFSTAFTMDDAKRAGLCDPQPKSGKVRQNWVRYPAAMLRARAISAACRAYCPDLLSGGGLYTPDEIESIETIEVVSRPVEPDAKADRPALGSVTEEALTDLIGRIEQGDENAIVEARSKFRAMHPEQQARVTVAVKSAQADGAPGEGS